MKPQQMYRRIKKYLDEELVFHIDKTIWLNKHGYGYGSFLIHTTKLTSNSAKYNPLDNLSSSQGPMNLRPTKISPRLWLHEISKFPPMVRNHDKGEIKKKIKKEPTFDIFVSFKEILSKSYDFTRQNFIFPSLSRSVDENFRKFLADYVLDSL